MREVESDSTYESVVTPLLLEVLRPQPDGTYLDLGCGEGRVLRSIEAQGCIAYGVELNYDLAAMSNERAVVAKLPMIPVRAGSFDGVYAVLVLEHVSDEEAFFRECARVTRPGGVMAIVCNHPVWTAPGSTPITDGEGEKLWRPGKYFSSGRSELSAGSALIEFHHRTMSSLLNAAAGSGWSLENMIEKPHHELEDQSEIPRLLACQWRI